MKNHIFKVEAKRGSYSAGFYIGILVLTAAGIIGAGDLKDAMGEIDYIGGYVWCTESWYQGMHSEIFIFSIACGVYITGKRIVFRRSAKWNIDVYYAKDIQKTIRF